MRVFLSRLVLESKIPLTKADLGTWFSILRGLSNCGTPREAANFTLHFWTERLSRDEKKRLARIFAQDLLKEQISVEESEVPSPEERGIPVQVQQRIRGILNA
jgi:hypothetical protein